MRSQPTGPAVPSRSRRAGQLTPALALTGIVLVGVLLTGCSGVGGSASPSRSPSASAPSASASSPPAGRPLTIPATDRAFAALEQQYGAQVGVRVLDTGSGDTLGYRDDTRFAFASTSKVLSAGLLLRTASDAELDTVVHYDQADVLEYAPITSQHVATGMTLRDLIAAALQYSDNTAANLLTEQLGGPAAVQAALRELGDGTTNVDRTEPDLNEATPGDVRDTTTPRAMATALDGFAVGDLLRPARRALLDSLLEGNTTGGPYIRAGVPAGWTVGDKTGNGSYGTRNDIAVVTPPGRAPIVIVILTNRGSTQDASSDDALIADVTRQVVESLR